MLVLTRRIGQTLQIGANVQVTVLARSGNQVKIGIRAPKDIAVHRAELIGRMHPESVAVPSTAES